jgi:hypothetical protein
MPNESRPRTASDILRDLHNFIANPTPDVDDLSDEKVAKQLEKRCLDPAPSFEAIHDLLDEKLAEIELSEAKEKRERKLAERNHISTPIGELREKVRTLIESLSPQTAGVFFSKFESASNEDLASLYEDLSSMKEVDPNEENA